MKLTIQKTEEQEPEIIIKCCEVNSELQKIMDFIENTEKIIIVQNNGAMEKLNLDDIYYFESVDEQTFVYTMDKVYQYSQKLYELERILENTSFVRISKSCILNTDYLESVRAAFNGRLEALLSNHEKVIINRHYVPQFKRKFGL